jgi:pimeloyl-ACP methyl ester carboxylesterase
MQTPSFTPFHRGGKGSPLVCIHGFTDTWRTWELVLPALEREHDVLALTLAGHAGGPKLGADASDTALADALERSLDEAGISTAHIVGNSLGGYMAFKLAERARAETVLALAPAGGWAVGDDEARQALQRFRDLRPLLQQAAPNAQKILATPEGRRRATEYTAVNFEHIPAQLLEHQLLGAALCEATLPLSDYAAREGWSVDAASVGCPVRIVWGTADNNLRWPRAAYRYREQWFPNADWIELDGVGHCPQLDVPLETAELILGFTR